MLHDTEEVFHGSTREPTPERARLPASGEFKTRLLLLLILLRRWLRILLLGSTCLSGAPARTRTWDQLIKSQLLYQLSYRGN